VKKKIFSIWSVLLVLVLAIAVLVPGCAGGGGDEEGEPCTIDVKATLDGSAWTGAVQYTLTGPGAVAPTIINGASVAATHSNVNCGNWTCAYVSGGPAGASFVNITPSATQSVSAGSTITFTLNFVTPTTTVLDHFSVYWVDWVQQGDWVEEVVQLEDQFGAFEATVMYSEFFANPAAKTCDGVVTPIRNPDHHLTLYLLSYEEEPQTWRVEVNNQFGTQQLTVTDPVWLAVPTQKEGHGLPEGLDHFLLYEVTNGADLQVTVYLEDQFYDEVEVMVAQPVYFANPVRKTDATGMGTEIEDPDEHLVFYAIENEFSKFETVVNVANQFTGDTFVSWNVNVWGPDLLAVPSEKKSAERIVPTLDHFRCYWVEQGGLVGAVVQLEDQFCALVNANVTYRQYFCNPVAKTYDGVPMPISNPDNHLTFYYISREEESRMWNVEVDNQFGRQELTVIGPVGLAVPTQKEGHGLPEGLDHFLLYYAYGTDMKAVVDLEDQWHREEEVQVLHPAYFANPVRKTDATGMVTEIKNPDEHLVFYEIEGQTFQMVVNVNNQFGPQDLVLISGGTVPDLLAVPSEKIGWEEQPLQ